jgi:uncharacterized membrane protein
MDSQMINSLLFALTFFSALSCGLMAGVFFAFSAFVMDGLSRLPAQQSIAAMQFINAAAFNPWFATAFCGTTAACVLLTVVSLFMWHKPTGIFHLAGALLYLIGAILVKIGKRSAFGARRFPFPAFVAMSAFSDFAPSFETPAASSDRSAFPGE